MTLASPSSLLDGRGTKARRLLLLRSTALPRLRLRRAQRVALGSARLASAATRSRSASWKVALATFRLASRGRDVKAKAAGVSLLEAERLIERTPRLLVRVSGQVDA